MTTDIAIPETWTPPAIARSADHRYTYSGDPSSLIDPYGGVTDKLSVIDKSDVLKRWAANQTADAAIAHIADLPKMLETVGNDGVRSFLTSRANWTLESARELGSDVHAMADLVVKGEPTPPMAEPTRKRVLGYAEWWKASGWTLWLAEAMVVFPTHRYGGTFDLLAYDRDGKTVLADIKTGKGVYKEVALQLAAYGLAPIVAPSGSPTAYPMPAIDRYVVLHVTLDGVREVEINVGTAEHMAWMACIDLHAWTESMKGKRF